MGDATLLVAAVVAGFVAGWSMRAARDDVRSYPRTRVIGRDLPVPNAVSRFIRRRIWWFW